MGQKASQKTLCEKGEKTEVKKTAFWVKSPLRHNGSAPVRGPVLSLKDISQGLGFKHCRYLLYALVDRRSTSGLMCVALPPTHEGRELHLWPGLHVPYALLPFSCSAFMLFAFCISCPFVCFMFSVVWWHGGMVVWWYGGVVARCLPRE